MPAAPVCGVSEAPEELCKYLYRAVGGSRVDSGLGLWGGGLEQQEGSLGGGRWLPVLGSPFLLGLPEDADHLS